MRVLGISGSLRRNSYNTALLRHAGDLFEAEGAEFEIYQGLRDVPPYDEDCDTEEAPEAVSRIREAVRNADAVFFVTPEYNTSIPGALKNALDWLSRPVATNPLRYKPVAVIGASSGMFGAIWAQAELRKVLGAIGARVTEGEVAVGHAGERFDENDRLNEPNLEQEVHEVVATLLGDTQPAKTSPPAANAAAP
ncbi:MAG TPA: NADPH-dependent FMN reductase [Solirubrobacteraceae bacterium]|jgi:chromate reductase|nr:NADPH-dependent FMN reductase [Solirubrobacteraceae bacterium]